MARTRRSEPGAAAAPGPPVRRARLFLALDLPRAERAALAAWRDRAIAGRADLRAVPEAALHVTLVFLGAQPEEEIGAIAAEAFAPLSGLAAPRLTPRGVTGLPPRRPRLFALDLGDAGGRAAAVHTALAEALERAGRYAPERRPFWPHVTLARVRSGARAEALAGTEPPQGAFTAPEVTLYRSLLHPQGARYEAIERMALTT